MKTRIKRIAACLLIVFVVWKTYSLITRDWYLVTRIPGSGKEITAIAYSPDGSTLAFSSRGAPKVHVWDLISKKRKFILDRRNVTDMLQFTESEDLVGTGPSNADYARVWNSSGQVVKSYRTEDEFEAEMPDYGLCCKYRVESQRELKGDEDSFELTIQEIKSGKIVVSIRCDGFEETESIGPDRGCIRGIVLEPEKTDSGMVHTGKTILVNLIDGSFSELPYIYCVSGNTVVSLPMKDMVAIFEGYLQLNRGVELWDLKKKSQIGKFPYHSRSIAPIVRFSREGKHLVVAGGEIHPYDPLPLLGPKSHYGEVKIWEIATSRVLSQYTSDRAVTAIEFSPDGRHLAVGFEDGTVEILDESFTLTQAGK
jgi:WD40 repeat protein